MRSTEDGPFEVLEASIHVRFGRISNPNLEF